jgi:flavorubredoxin
MIAPSHGLIWRANPYRIIELYNQWADYANKSGDPSVAMVYASMYGNPERIMEAVAQGIVDEGVPISIYNVSRDSTSEILPSLWLKRGVMVGAPTYEGKLFVDMVNLLEMARRKHIFQKICAGFGSHAWMGGGQTGIE